VTIEVGIGVPALDDSWWILWYVGGGIVLLPTFSNPSDFQSPISNAGLDFGFSNSLKVPPNCPKFIQSPIFYLVKYYGGNWKIQKSPNCPKISYFTQKSPNFQFRRQSPISKVQKLSNLKGTQPDQPIMSTVESFKIKFHLCKTAGLVDNWSIS
jgi:hypothetical protein